MNTQMKAMLAAGAVAGAAAYSVSSQAAANRSAEDQRITKEVIDRIANDSRLRHDAVIQVETHDGAVTLTGFVDLPDQADKVGRDAEGVEGVRDVDNIVRPRVGQNFF